ncbi:ABC transporter substrate-binding protein [Duganella radicis]|uniref:ABC transporter substrate-binding protein n=1 Tax=Duganella radicis TaxID=551988 RepID=A0A6L6PBQ2_9BURK|nr:ABC transporter substrate-binding protein [Duganella radicis]MTV35997.1 ABC transporter substrate-binding protein [Duganella radicis]
MPLKPLIAVLPAVFAFTHAAAQAQVKVGVSLSATGPAASLGIAQKNSVALLPTKIGNTTIEYIVLDDASDSTTAVKNERKLVTEQKVDLILGSTTSPNSLAMIDLAAESGTPLITMAAAASLVEPMDAKRKWIFKTSPNDAHMASAIVNSMVDQGVKTAGFIGFADAYGESWYREFARLAEQNHIKIVASERFARTDTSVTGQALKIIGANPDAVLIAGAGTPAALPQKTLKERAYRGKLYQTHGVTNNDFLRVCGADCEGTFVAAGPLVVADQLSDAFPMKQAALSYKNTYEKAYGAGSASTFGSHAWDAGLLLSAALPEALKKGKPGTREFRQGLRDALENIKNLPVSHGIVNMGPNDHVGLDRRARVLVKITNGKWTLPEAK